MCIQFDLCQNEYITSAFSLKDFHLWILLKIPEAMLMLVYWIELGFIGTYILDLIPSLVSRSSSSLPSILRLLCLSVFHPPPPSSYASLRFPFLRVRASIREPHEPSTGNATDYATSCAASFLCHRENSDTCSPCLLGHGFTLRGFFHFVPPVLVYACIQRSGSATFSLLGFA